MFLLSWNINGMSSDRYLQVQQQIFSQHISPSGARIFWVSTMAADALAPNVDRSSAAVMLTL